METLLLKVDEAASVLGLGRSKVYELIAAGQIEHVKIGAARRIPADALRDWVERQRSTRTIKA